MTVAAKGPYYYHFNQPSAREKCIELVHVVIRSAAALVSGMRHNKYGNIIAGDTGYYSCVCACRA